MAYGPIFGFGSLDLDIWSFMRLLYLEENVDVLPGSAFRMMGGRSNDNGRDYNYAFRVVFCAPENILLDAAERISSFCIRHKRV